MGISVYYTAKRRWPLTATEQAVVEQIVRAHSAASIERPDWEDFCTYTADKNTEANVIFEGATRLPNASEDDFWEAIQHWCRVLSLIRQILPDATWSVHVDDHPIPWVAEFNAFDPSG